MVENASAALPGRLVTFTEAVLVACLPQAPAAAVTEFAPALHAAAHQFGLATPVRAAAWLAQIGHESSSLRHLIEDLGYSAKRLAEVWPRVFALPPVPIGRVDAREFAGHPERIANFVYAGRNGNGAEMSGDGWRYRGRGLIQLTGRANYREAGRALQIDLESAPEMAMEPLAAARVAAWFFISRRCERLADMNDAGAFEGITRRINGGLNGQAERVALWTRAKRVLGVA